LNPAAHVIGRLAAAGLVCLLALGHADARCQSLRSAVAAVDVQRLANAVLGVMSYTVTPDVTTSSLSVSNAPTGNPSLSMTQFGGGFTWSKQTPLYLEGNAAFSRYDPIFVVSSGGDTRQVPLKWNAVSATGGIGWDFPITEHWVLRPIFNFTLGTVASDLSLARWWIEDKHDVDLSFLDGGRFKAYGVGGSLMLDYEKFAPGADDDLEIRYTNVALHGYGDRSRSSVEGRASAESLGIWARRRVPTGWTMFERPVRYVFEGAFTRFLSDQQETGLKQMTSLGVGLELDTSAEDIWVTRWRAVVRYKFGPELQGWALGLAISF